MTELAFDLGATSGRAAIGSFDGDVVTIDEIHRFPNDPVQVGDRLHWDILRLYHEMKLGIRKANARASGSITSLGIDTWGLDFGVVDGNGDLISNPYHHRDPVPPHVMDHVWNRVSRRSLFARTGIQHMQVNTLFRLVELARAPGGPLERADAVLQIPDLLRFFLTGERINEYTNATTTQGIAIGSGEWDRSLLECLDVPSRLFRNVTHPPVVGAPLRAATAGELGMGKLTTIVVAEHDTASAVVAVPAQPPFAYLSCGTWSLLGTETSAPVLDDRAFDWNFSNEGGVFGTYRLLKNIMGLWIVERCRLAGSDQGSPMTYDEVQHRAMESPPFASLLDPDAPELLNPHSMPDAIRAWCTAHGQPAPLTTGALLRCVLEGLALKYRLVLDRLESLTGVTYPCLHLVGGGVNNPLLCQFTANAIGRPVHAGPAEATTIGNVLMQLVAKGSISTLAEAREVVEVSFRITTYDPEGHDRWNEAFQTFEQLLTQSADRNGELHD